MYDFSGAVWDGEDRSVRDRSAASGKVHDLRIKENPTSGGSGYRKNRGCCGGKKRRNWHCQNEVRYVRTMLSRTKLNECFFLHFQSPHMLVIFVYHVVGKGTISLAFQ